MAGRKKENFDRGRVEFKADPAWIEAIAKEGERLGLNLSSFIRFVLSQYMERVQSERSSARKGGRQ